MKVGIVVGRFQVRQLHQGHRALLETAEHLSDRLVVFLGGSRCGPNRREPMDFKTRQLLINEAFPHAIVLPQHDHFSDEIWSKNIDNQIYALFPDMTETTLYGGRDSCLPHYQGTFNKVEIEDSDLGSGTKEREELARYATEGEDFRHGCIYTVYHTRPAPVMAVDIALIREFENKTIVLLGRKPGEELWRFPGGKVDVTDESLEACGRRELQEEAGIFAEHMEYVMSHLVSDWRYAKNPDAKIITALYIGREMSYQTEKAGDDLKEVKWFNIDGLTGEGLVTAHRPLFKALKDHLNKGKKDV